MNYSINAWCKLYIGYLYGEEINRDTRWFERLQIKCIGLLSTLAFLQHCRDYPLFNLSKTWNYLKVCCFALIQERILHRRFELDQLSGILYCLHSKLAKMLTVFDCERTNNTVAARAEVATFP